MNREFWIDNGGDPSWLTIPFSAPKAMQDLIAYTGFTRRGWEPWECAAILGIS